MLKNIEKLHESILKEKNTLRKKYFEKNKKHKTAIENVKLASDIFEREYVEAMREKFGCRAINEKLYVPFLLEKEEEEEEGKTRPAPFDVLKGNLRERPIGFARLRAATPMRKDKDFTFPTGTAVEAAADAGSRPAAAAAGKNVTKRRIEAFILGAVIMGLAGAFLGQHLRLIEPTQTFDPSKMTFLVWVMLIAGGSGNNKGAILGAFLIWFVWSSSELVTNGVIEILATMFDSVDISILKNRAGFIRMLFIGLLLQFILQRFPKGILPEKRPAISGKSQKYAG